MYTAARSHVNVNAYLQFVSCHSEEEEEKKGRGGERWWKRIEVVPSSIISLSLFVSSCGGDVLNKFISDMAKNNKLVKIKL